MELKENKAFLSEREIRQTGFESPIEINSRNLEAINESIKTEEEAAQNLLAHSDVLSRNEQICRDFMKARIGARRQVYLQLSNYAVASFAKQLHEIKHPGDLLNPTG